MRSGWKPFGAFTATVIAIVALVVIATRNETQSMSLLAIEVAFVGSMAYLVTFLVWPRKQPRVVQPEPAQAPVKATKAAPVPDQRPVVIIGERPAGSKPGAELHVRDWPTERAARGRRPGPRPQADIKWPAKR